LLGEYNEGAKEVSMYRFKVSGINRAGKEMTCYVAAKDRDEALAMAWDDMGLMRIDKCVKVSSKQLKN